MFIAPWPEIGGECLANGQNDVVDTVTVTHRRTQKALEQRNIDIVHEFET